MKYADVYGLSEKELIKKANELRKQIFEANMKNALGQLPNPMTIRFMRRDVARLKTALSAKLNGVAKVSATPKKKAAAGGRKSTKVAAKG
jgi:large subunit ribosomal protein L29